MFVEHVGTLRDVALVLLAIESIVLAAIPLFVLFYITKGLAGFSTRVRPAVRTAHCYVLRGATIVDRGMRIIRTPFEWLGGEVDMEYRRSRGPSDGAGGGMTV